MQLEHWDIRGTVNPGGRVAVRPFGGLKKLRTWFARRQDSRVHLLRCFNGCSYSDVMRYDGGSLRRAFGRRRQVMVWSLSVGDQAHRDDRRRGVVHQRMRWVFPFTTNLNIKTGDGMALAFPRGR